MNKLEPDPRVTPGPGLFQSIVEWMRRAAQVVNALVDGLTSAQTSLAAKAYDKLSEVTPAVAATLVIALPAGYSHFKIEVIGVKPAGGTGSNGLYLRLYQGGALQAGASDYFHHSARWFGGSGAVVDGAASYLSLAEGGNNAVPEETHASLTLDPGAPGVRGAVWGICRHLDSSGQRVVTIIGHQVLVATARADAVLFGWAGGSNFAGVGKVIVSGAKS